MSQFTLSCTTCATRQPNKDEVDECFTHAPKAGYKAWSIAGPICWTPGLVQWIDTEKLVRQANAVGLTQCTEVYGPAFPTDSIETAEAAAQHLVLLFDLAEKLGSPLVVITGRKRTDIGLEATIRGIEALLPLIEGRSVKLALEPHYGAQIQYLEDYDAIFERIKTPQVGITLDSGHFHSAGVDWQQVIDKYTDRIYNFHVKDHLGTQSVAIGAGEVDLKAYIKALHTVDYEGALAVELEVEDFENLIRYGAEAYIHLRNMVIEVTGEAPL